VVAGGSCWEGAGFGGWDCGDDRGAAIPTAGEQAHAIQKNSGKILARFIPGTKLPKPRLWQFYAHMRAEIGEQRKNPDTILELNG
jgi:hypothetical protein